MFEIKTQEEFEAKINDLNDKLRNICGENSDYSPQANI